MHGRACKCACMCVRVSTPACQERDVSSAVGLIGCCLMQEAVDGADCCAAACVVSAVTVLQGDFAAAVHFLFIFFVWGLGCLMETDVFRMPLPRGSRLPRV